MDSERWVDFMLHNGAEASYNLLYDIIATRACSRKNAVRNIKAFVWAYEKFKQQERRRYEETS